MYLCPLKYNIRHKDMKVLIVNGSQHKTGCTHTALMEVAKELEKAGIEGPYVLCPHYVHDYEYEKISKEIRNLLKKMY